MRKADKNKIEAFEIWTWRRMLGVKWEDKVSNVEILNRIDEERSITKPISRRKRNWIGHILRENTMLHTALDGHVNGKNQRRRKRITMLNDVRNGQAYVDVKRKAEARDYWRNLSR